MIDKNDDMQSMGRPKVSVILATYNRAHFLDAAIESVRSQSFQGWELIISDDGSTDNTRELAQNWKNKEPRIVYLKSEKNAGISGNYNKAIRAAKAEYIAMMDDDDPWVCEDKLERQVDFLDAHQECVGVGGGMIVVDNEGEERFRYLKPEADTDIRRDIFFSNPMANSTTLFRKSAAESVGLYDVSIEHGADRDFWLKMGRVGKLHNIQDYFTYYTLGGQNAIFRSQRKMFRCILNFMKRYKNDYPRYYSGRLFYTCAYIYSFLPSWIRSFSSGMLFRVKHSMFDSVRK